MKKGDKVQHFKFGRGIVINVCDGFAQVDFYNFGKKSIMFEALSLVEDESVSDGSVSKLKLIETAMAILNENRKVWMRLFDITPIIIKRVGVPLTKEQLKEHLDADDDMVFSSRMQDIKNNIAKNGDVRIEVASELKHPANEFKTKTATEHFNDFQNLCTKLRVTDSTQVFFARCILSFSNHYLVPRLTIKRITDYIFGAYLYQTSIGFMFNVQNNTNNHFYPAVEEVYQNIGDLAISQKAHNEIYGFIKCSIL